MDDGYENADGGAARQAGLFPSRTRTRAVARFARGLVVADRPLAQFEEAFATAVQGCHQLQCLPAFEAFDDGEVLKSGKAGGMTRGGRNGLCHQIQPSADFEQGFAGRSTALPAPAGGLERIGCYFFHRSLREQFVEHGTRGNVPGKLSRERGKTVFAFVGQRARLAVAGEKRRVVVPAQQYAVAALGLFDRHFFGRHARFQQAGDFMAGKTGGGRDTGGVEWLVSGRLSAGGLLHEGPFQRAIEFRDAEPVVEQQIGERLQSQHGRIRGFVAVALSGIWRTGHAGMILPYRDGGVVQGGNRVTKLRCGPLQAWFDGRVQGLGRGLCRCFQVGMLLLVASCGGARDGADEGAFLQPRELHRSLGGEPDTLDPQLAGDTYAYEVLRDAYEGLVTEDPSGRLVPGQALRWEVSSDGREYRFTLRPGLRWSDGQPLVAADFVNALRRVVDPHVASPNGPLLRVVEGANEVMAGKRPVTALGVTAPDPAHVVVRLVHAAAFLPALLAHPLAFPYRAGPPVFNGAYRLDSWVPGRPLRAWANVHYRAAADVAIQRVSYVGLADENLELLRYRAGSVDVTGGLPADGIAWARSHLPGQVQIAPQAATFFLGLNLRQGVLREAPLARRALGMAIDRERLTREVLRAGQTPAYGLVPPGLAAGQGARLAWAGLPAAERLGQARELYAAAGYSSAHPLRLRLLYNRNTTVRRAVLAIALMWREGLGVEVETVDEEFIRFLSLRREPGAWEVVRLGWNADYADPVNFLEVFESGSSDNTVGFSSGRYDALLARIRRLQGKERESVLREAEAELLAADAMVPVYFLVTRRLVRPTVITGLPNPMNHNYTRHWRWAAPVAGSPAAR